MDGKIDVAIGPNATELRSNVVNDRLSTVIELRLAEIPLLLTPDHGIELVYRGDEGELGVLQDLSVSLGQLLVFSLLADAGSTNKAIVLASLAREFAVTLGFPTLAFASTPWPGDKVKAAYLGLLHSTPLTGFPNPLVPAIGDAMGDMVVVCRGTMWARALRGVTLGLEDFG